MNKTRGSMLKPEYRPAVERLATGAETPPVAPENAALLARCRAASGLRAMAAVYDALEQPFAARRPVVGTLCNFVPDELVLAAGAIPLQPATGQPAASTRVDSNRPVNLADSLVELQQAQREVEVAAAVIDTADEVLGTLIDIRV